MSEQKDMKLRSHKLTFLLLPFISFVYIRCIGDEITGFDYWDVTKKGKDLVKIKKLDSIYDPEIWGSNLTSAFWCL